LRKKKNLHQKFCHWQNYCKFFSWAGLGWFYFILLYCKCANRFSAAATQCL